jgi:alkanesulfonate monooxygenase SsuD/methylene tetrahydromethanopterin reductase-like flavin-dependent oxidoreductase (luciferase family)
MQMTQPSIGLAISRPTPSAAIKAIIRAEEGGLPAVWSTVIGTAPDAVTTLAVAAARTQHITIGTSIVPAYPRHPIALAAQALVFADLAPGRFRLGVGPSHRASIEGMFGIPMTDPLGYMKEFIAVLRRLLWEGRVDLDGTFFSVHAALPPAIPPPHTPLLLSALRPNAFRQAGAIADGAISWNCPIPYLLDTALPALRAGAEEASRPAPPLIAHVPVAISENSIAAREAARRFLRRYAQLPFYAGMFAAAGYPVPGDGTVPDTLLDEVVVMGSGGDVVNRLDQILSTEIDEVLVSIATVSDVDREEGELIAALGQAR